MPRAARRPIATVPNKGRPSGSEHAGPVALASILQRQAGNRAVNGLVSVGGPAARLLTVQVGVNPGASLAVSRALDGSVVVQRAPGPLTPAQERAAVTFNRAQYDANSIRAIQVIVATAVDGSFGPISAQAVASFQQARGIAVSGQVDQPTLDAVVARSVTTGRQDYGIYAAADFFAIPTRANALTVSFNKAQVAAGANSFEPGGLRVITLGPTAMTNSATIRNTINAQLALPAPAVAAPGATPTLLTPNHAKSAITANRAKWHDPRSIRAIQAFIGATPDGIFSADTVQRVANFQNGAGLKEDGVIGRITINPLVMGMAGAGSQNGAIRAIIDFYRLDQNGLVDTHFDTADPNNATTTAQAIPGDSAITISPKAFTQGFAGLVHTVAHEFEHVRQNRVGIADLPISEFLGERVEILSKGMDEEGLAGFVDDASRALAQWNLMPAAQRRVNFAKFVEVRTRVRARLAKAPHPLSAGNQTLLTGFNAVTKP